MSNQKQPLISVLVPVYNVQKYLGECLDSLRVQTFADFEVICINDGSTDASREIIEDYLQRDDRFSLIDKENSGYGASMNRGLDAARGLTIAILESDDFYEPTTLERLYGAIEEFDAEVAKANCFYYWQGPPAKNVFHDLVPHTQTGRLVNPQIEHRIFLLNPSIWAGLYRREFLLNNGIRFTETPGASYQDAGFNFKVWASATRAVFLKDALIHYRQDNQTSSVNSLSKVYCVCDEIMEMDRFLAARGATPHWLRAIRARMKYDFYIWNYERIADAFQLEFLQRFAAEMTAESEQGNLDWQLFEPWSKIDLESILNSPEHYHAARIKAGRGKAGRALHYLRSGGPVVLLRFLGSKLFHRY